MPTFNNTRRYFQQVLNWVSNGMTAEPVKKHNKLTIRRIKLKDGRIYELAPSFMMPYLSGQTSLISNGLLLRHWSDRRTGSALLSDCPTLWPVCFLLGTL